MAKAKNNKKETKTSKKTTTTVSKTENRNFIKGGHVRPYRPQLPRMGICSSAG